MGIEDLYGYIWREIKQRYTYVVYFRTLTELEIGRGEKGIKLFQHGALRYKKLTT